jgi:flagellum-specific ATP synthase
MTWSSQRVGIFGGSGVGKSTLIGMMARNTSADLTVLGLIGERGREVKDFLETLGEEGRKRSVVVVSTSDQSPLLRIRAALAATAVAEYFSALGKHVLLVVDSLTRLAMAQREIGLAAGEPATAKGYTPSVFSMLARLIERAGQFSAGSITAFYTVLMEGDDQQDPLVDGARALLDGHVMLDRALASRNHYPPIAVLGSVSRIMPSVCSKDHLSRAKELPSDGDIRGRSGLHPHWSVSEGWGRRTGSCCRLNASAQSVSHPGTRRVLRFRGNGGQASADRRIERCPSDSR